MYVATALASLNFYKGAAAAFDVFQDMAIKENHIAIDQRIDMRIISNSSTQRAAQKLAKRYKKKNENKDGDKDDGNSYEAGNL